MDDILRFYLKMKTGVARNESLIVVEEINQVKSRIVELNITRSSFISGSAGIIVLSRNAFIKRMAIKHDCLRFLRLQVVSHPPVIRHPRIRRTESGDLSAT